LKNPSAFRLISKDVMRIELPTKVNGSAKYSIDIQVPGMLYGAVLRAPVDGSAPEKFDEAKVKAIAGVVKAVKLPHGVGVIAETPWAAFAARQAVADSVSWSKAGKAWGFDSDKGLDTFAAAARDTAVNGSDWFKLGDARAEMPKAATTMEAEYLCDYAYHAQMEPLNAVASVSAAG
jgi:isoquinoline 1-oxidoreductase subunit beta